MKRKTGKRLQLFAGIVMMIILLLFTDLLICGIVVIRNNSADYHDSQEILMHLFEKMEAISWIRKRRKNF